MSYLMPVTVIPSSFSDPALEVFGGAVSPAFPVGPETDALGHWILGGDASSLVARNNNSVSLTPAAVAPTYDDVSMIISSAGRHGLNTPFHDNDLQSGTVAIVLKHEELTANKVAWGTCTTTAGDGGQQGHLVSNAEVGNDVSFLSRGSAAQLRVNASASDAGYMTGLSAGDFYILMWAWNNAEGLALFSPGSKARGGPNDYAADGASRTYVPSTDNKLISIGNVVYNSASWQGGLAMAEVAIFDWKMSQAEMIGLAGRMVRRQADRPTPVTVRA